MEGRYRKVFLIFFEGGGRLGKILMKRGFGIEMERGGF